MRTKYSIALVLIAIFWSGCKPDTCNDGNYYQYQLERDLKVVPYKDFSQLTFVNKTTRDTLLFVGQGYVYDWGKYVEQGECPQTYNLQRRYIVFGCAKNGDQIIIQNTFETPGGRSMYFGFRKNGKKTSSTYLGAPHKYDSIKIENKYYYNVNDLTQIKSITDIGFLYTLNEGIIRLIYPTNNDTLNLINIQ